jgi:lipopolysaccharide export system permease protein
MTVDRYLLRQFFPIFLSALALFMMLVLLIDLFFYLVRYLANDADIVSILRVSLYYIPKSFSYALPVSLLFASSYTLGDLGAKNELITMLGAGMPFWRFCLSLVLIGIIASFFAFFFEDHAVIPALRRKNELNRELLHNNTENISGVVIKLRGGRLIYAVDYFDNSLQTLNGVTILELDGEGNFISMISTPRASWSGTFWSFSDPLIYKWDRGFLRPFAYEEGEQYDENPETFRRSAVSAADLKSKDAALLIRDLKRAGLPVAAARTDYYRRFSFSAVSFVVIFLSLAMSGRFKKNILLLSLLASLGSAVIFYVIEMITMMSAKAGLLSPLLGAWTPVFICTAAAFVLLRYSRV